jgi:hypothetical protein
MNTFLVRLLIGWICFTLSVSLTNLTRVFRGAAPSEDVIASQPAVSKYEFSEDELQLRKIYREYGPAQTVHDRGFFERVETDDFRLFYNNTSISREEDLRWMESMPRDIVYHTEPLNINIFGNSAVARGIFELRYSDGHVQRSHFIDVWVKRGNKWQIRSTTSSD